MKSSPIIIFSFFLLGIKGQFDYVPVGTIAAFNGACPTGWIPFGPAAGNVLVGVGGAFALGTSGGVTEVTLTTA